MAEKLPLETTCHAVKARLDAGDDFVLLDCRETDEYEIVCIESAQLLPMSELMARASELEPHRDRDIVVHCHHGGRSMQVTRWLRQQGYVRAQSMAGGIDAWAVEINPELPRY
ncbi:MAG TPA: rhodanese-like domain-containing protein [Pirellulales bacterium]|jgi:rhodanese-related sulfurtransferase|nr:rhodanese-like domain-containing protein [Pirellulales bacterium]